MTRREFTGSCAAFAVAGRGMAEPESPPLRLGIVTDTHVGSDAASCSRVAQAMALFRRERCDVLVNNGDIADRFTHAGYAALREICDRAFAGCVRRPTEIWTYAWHDAFGWNDRPREDVYATAAEAWFDLKKDLRITHHHTDSFVFAGYAFLLFPQFIGIKGFLSREEYESKVAEACRANPGKPVFVIDHVPPQGSIHDSWHWGDPWRRSVLSKYPQVVQFAGHAHGSVRSDRQVWQDGFTVVSAGCLQNWYGCLAGNDQPPSPKSYGALTVDIRPAALTVRRWDVRDGKEVGAPWVIPLPFAAETAPWNRARRVRELPPPRFADDAAVTVAAEDGRASAFRVSFPDVAAAETFRVGVFARGAGGAWEPLTRRDAMGAWWQAPQDRPARIESSLDSIFFEPKRAYLFRVAPVCATGTVGRSVETTFATPEALPERACVWSVDRLAAACPCRAVGRDAVILPDAAGWLPAIKPYARLRLTLPRGIFNAPKGTKFRFVFEAETDGGTVENMPVLRLVPREGHSGSASRPVPLADPAAGRLRYLLMFWKGEKSKTPDDYDLQIDYGTGTRLRFGSCRLYAARNGPPGGLSSARSVS